MLLTIAVALLVTFASSSARSLQLLSDVPGYSEQFVENDNSAVPSFLIIGTAKGGTTDLYEQLALPNPERTEPPVIHSKTKEPGMLSNGGLDLIKFLPGRIMYKAYITLLEHPCCNYTNPNELKECMAYMGRRYYTIDATPTSFFSPVAPINLLSLSKRSKVIMMIRDPLDRLEALYRHLVVHENKFPDTSLDTLADNFLQYIRSRPHIHSILASLIHCTTVTCLADGWRDLTGYGLIDEDEGKLFATGLYRYALATWRQHYFQPGRVMIIDSHTYFVNRVAVMEKVTRFLYGRDMLPAERTQAESGSFWRKDSSLQLALSPERRNAFELFYHIHVKKDLPAMLSQMRSEGAWVVGFGDKPWVH